MAAGGGSGTGTTGGARQDSGDDGSLEDPDELWGKDKEQKEEHHEGQVCSQWRQKRARGICCLFVAVVFSGVVLTS